MVPAIIHSFEEFQEASKFVSGMTSLFWIIEYSPTELGYIDSDSNYLNDINRFSLMRMECLKNPSTFKERLNNKNYRIWTVVPIDTTW